MKSHLMPIRISKKRKCEDKEEDYLYSTVENSHFLDQTERRHSVSQLMLLLFFFSIDCCCFRLVRKIKTKTKKMRKHLTFNFQPVAFITEVLVFLFFFQSTVSCTVTMTFLFSFSYLYPCLCVRFVEDRILSFENIYIYRSLCSFLFKIHIHKYSNES